MNTTTAQTESTPTTPCGKLIPTPSGAQPCSLPKGHDSNDNPNFMLRMHRV